MGNLDAFWLTHPFWGWLALSAVLLVTELMTGSGWLLWPAAAAAVVALVTLAMRGLGLDIQTALFAALAVAATLAARPWARRTGTSGHDINDPHRRLIGHGGRAAATFFDGRGRVLIDGKEWAAELEGGECLPAGAPVIVTALLGGARLRVRPSGPTGI